MKINISSETRERYFEEFEDVGFIKFYKLKLLLMWQIGTILARNGAEVLKVSLEAASPSEHLLAALNEPFIFFFFAGNAGWLGLRLGY